MVQVLHLTRPEPVVSEEYWLFAYVLEKKKTFNIGFSAFVNYVLF